MAPMDIIVYVYQRYHDIRLVLKFTPHVQTIIIKYLQYDMQLPKGKVYNLTLL